MGHADLNATHIYVEIDMETKRRMLAKVDSPSIDKQAPWRSPHLAGKGEDGVVRDAYAAVTKTHTAQ